MAFAAGGSALVQRTLRVASNPVEECFYAAELEEGVAMARGSRTGHSGVPEFSSYFHGARETTCHPAASKKLQEAAGISGSAAFDGKGRFFKF